MTTKEFSNLEHEFLEKDREDRLRVAGASLLFLFVIIVAALDLVSDRGEGISLGHLLIEGSLVLVGVVGLVMMMARFVQLRRDAGEARADAAHAHATARDAHASAVEALANAEEALANAERAHASAQAAHAKADALETALKASQAEAQQWRSEAQELLQGLGEAIDVQFKRWSLSDAESEVALLLLKGLSHQEIAAIRKVKVATSRQQAQRVYKKAGLQGRHDLAAFFLEDLLLPVGSPSASTPK